MSLRTFNTFLDSQHSLNKGTRYGYKLAVQRYEDAVGKSFESTYLEEETIHKALAMLDVRLEDSTWNLCLEKFQRLAKYLSDPDDEDCPKVWRKIDFKKIDWNKKLKEKRFTEEEFYRLLDVIDYPRDKAFVAVSCEAGLRPGEALGMNIKDCKAESYGFKITVSGKTGTRSVPIVLFAPLLRQWLNCHPLKHDLDAPLWVQRSTHGFGRLSYSTMNRHHFKRYCKRANIFRRKEVKAKDGSVRIINGVSLHYLRHTKVTWTAKNRKVRISNKQANDMFGWSPNSNRYAHYTHLDGQDSEDAFLALSGVEEVKQEEKPSVLLRKKCFGCGEQNSAGALYCATCGTVLDEEQAKRLVADREMMDYFMKRYMEEQGKKKRKR